jgi:AcrR family transcriptional regulator
MLFHPFKIKRSFCFSIATILFVVKTNVSLYDNGMPKVSEEHIAKQRLAISIAARHCFAKSGFQNATMDEIIEETGMSSSTVYHYFPSKDSIIQSVCIEKTENIASAIDAMSDETIPGERSAPSDVFKRSVASLTHRSVPQAGVDERQVAYLAMNIWTQMYIDPDLQGLSEPSMKKLFSAMEKIAGVWKEDGMLRQDVSAADAVKIIWVYTLGFIASETAIGDTDIEGASRRLDDMLVSPR